MPLLSTSPTTAASTAIVVAAIKAGAITWNVSVPPTASHENEAWKLQRQIDTWSFALDRRVSASYVRYMSSLSRAQVVFRQGMRHRYAHRRRVLRFKRKLRLLVA